ncbi:MFS transporter [Microbaculum marinisediminis]|uniref:MFS transporter n=1 Tax=Microbaculum marinisediminis TaxID=2931392 RepID=A0AAW5QXT5_9HYPH|nr:MFS transporter [Microbaculum sp. A6E488]MCT8971164.1 MFS transporter [Microbaculum sp. A6E488]
MRPLLLSVTALLTSLTILLAGNSLQFVILALRAESAGFSLTVVGAMTTTYYLGYALGTLRAPVFVDRFGHIRAFAALSSIISAVVLAHGMLIEPYFWIALRFVTGLCFAGLATVTESWLNAKATRNVRGQLLAVASIVAILGYAVGPLFASFGEVDGLGPFVIASILMSVALVPVTLTRFSAPYVSGEGTEVERYTLARLIRETPFGTVGCFTTGLIQGAFLGLGAVFAGRLGLSDRAVPAFMTGALIAGALAQYPLGWFSDRFDRRFVVAITAVVTGLGALSVALLLDLIGNPIWVVAAAMAVGGIAAMPLYSIVIAHVNDRLPETSIVPAAATLILAFSIGSAVAGPVASLSIEHYGAAGIYTFFGVTLLAFGTFSVFRVARREAPEHTTDGGVFAASPVLTPIDTEFDENQLRFEFEEQDGPAEAGPAA